MAAQTVTGMMAEVEEVVVKVVGVAAGGAAYAEVAVAASQAVELMGEAAEVVAAMVVAATVVVRVVVAMAAGARAAVIKEVDVVAAGMAAETASWRRKLRRLFMVFVWLNLEVAAS